MLACGLDSVRLAQRLDSKKILEIMRKFPQSRHFEKMDVGMLLPFRIGFN
jgi:hypothetical protein